MATAKISKRITADGYLDLGWSSKEARLVIPGETSSPRAPISLLKRRTPLTERRSAILPQILKTREARLERARIARRDSTQAAMDAVEAAEETAQAVQEDRSIA